MELHFYYMCYFSIFILYLIAIYLKKQQIVVHKQEENQSLEAEIEEKELKNSYVKYFKYALQLKEI